jgi:hypothetical protein
MATSNILQQVQTYQMSSLALLQNLNCFIYTANTKFKDFEKLEANLGSTVTFDLPPRFSSNTSLVATFQDTQQRVQNLTVGNAYNVAYAFSNQEFIFNVEQYMDRFGKSAVAELGAIVESNVAQNCVTNTYRFFGDGVTAINSYGQLSQALAYYRNYGSPRNDIKVYLSDLAVPSIVNTGLNQFVIDRNEELANSWMIGDYDNASFYRSNLLPLHTAGSVGIAGSTLTVISLSADGTTLVVSGAALNDPAAILQYDHLQFQDNVAGQPNMRFLTFIGHQPSGNPVQVQATATAASDGAGHVTITISPPLISSAGSQNQNINNPVASGMQLKVLPSARYGAIAGGDSLFLAMPRLPEEVPFPTAAEPDPDTGVSMRMYYGSMFGQNQRGFVNDVIWGSTLVPEYAMALVFPLSQG